MIRDWIEYVVICLLVVAALFIGLSVMPREVFAAECAGHAGKASFYAEAHQGRTMANGRPFDMRAMTAASNSLPLGSRARVTSGKRSVVVTITDTGGFSKYGRIIDMSKASFARLANPAKGIIPVCVVRVR